MKKEKNKDMVLLIQFY